MIIRKPYFLKQTLVEYDNHPTNTLLPYFNVNKSSARIKLTKEYQISYL